MPVSEEVDEINEYLRIRREKQIKGELPKPDYTPPVVKRIREAIWGKKKVEKPVLKSVQPTYVSPVAQAAMRKQLAEVVDSAPPFVIPTPSPGTFPLPAQTDRPAPVSRTPLPGTQTQEKGPTLSSPPKRPSIFQYFFRNPFPRSVSPETRIVTPTTFPKTPLRVSPLRPDYAPIPPIPGKTTLPETTSAKKFGLIPLVPTRSSTLPETRNPTPDSIPMSEEDRIPPASSPIPTDAPPWVQRREQEPGMITAREAAHPSSETEKKLPWLTEKQIVPWVDRQKERSSAIFPETHSPLNTSIPRSETEKPVITKPWISGEIKVEESQPSPEKTAEENASPQTELEEEISEEEALERLPFEDVEGLTESDIDYLDKKEREHQAQRQKLEEDAVTPEELKEKLYQQEIRLETALKDEPASQTTQKEEILRRLKKMMQEEGDSAPPTRKN